jgi:hypothetical protein
MTEPLLSIVGGGLAAAVVTIGFNVWWDKQKERGAQDWEFKRYRANLIHGAAFGLLDVFFSAKTEIEYLVGTLGTLAAALGQLTMQADAIVRQQGGPQLTIVELERRKAELLQPFETYNQQQVNLRWNQYEQKVKDLEAKAQSYLSVLQPLIPNDLNLEINALAAELTADYVWNLPNACTRLQLFNDSLPRFQNIHGRLTAQIEVQLGRKPHNLRP